MCDVGLVEVSEKTRMYNCRHSYEFGVDGPHVLSTIPGGEIDTCMYTFHPSIHPIVQAIRKSRSSKAQNLGSSVFCDFIATISDISLLSISALMCCVAVMTGAA
jgi:hypothetical protein